MTVNDWATDCACAKASPRGVWTSIAMVLFFSGVSVWVPYAIGLFQLIGLKISQDKMAIDWCIADCLFKM